MDRWQSTRSSLGALGALAACAMSACAGSGPAIVEHPRSGSMVLVSPESDPLAGAWTYPSSGGARGASDPTLSVTTDPAATDPAATDPEPEVTTPSREHVWLRAADWSLALGNGETSASVAPAAAFSAALSLSVGPAPHLRHVRRGDVLVSVPEVAVEEGAWEARRR